MNCAPALDGRTSVDVGVAVSLGSVVFTALERPTDSSDSRLSVNKQGLCRDISEIVRLFLRQIPVVGYEHVMGPHEFLKLV